jgi:GTP 3',8-cyclase
MLCKLYNNLKVVNLNNSVFDISDEYGRRFKTLRISLTSQCNLGCTYCTLSGKSYDKKNNNKSNNSLSVEDLVTAVQSLNDILHLNTVRLTGGEPLLYHDLIPLIRSLKKINIHDLKMTTNGYLLAGKIMELKNAGLRNINISLDALDQDTFYKISRRKNLSGILEGIEQAVHTGLGVKINCVAMKGINDHQVIPLFEYAKDRNIPIRFLELMKMGHLQDNYQKFLLTQKEILKILSNEFSFFSIGRNAGATASYWELPGGYQFGIIANDSHPFCSDCDRLRLDSFGNIYGCLSSNTPVSIRSCIDDKVKLSERLQMVLGHKKIKFSGSTLSMKAIGG